MSIRGQAKTDAICIQLKPGFSISGDRNTYGGYLPLLSFVLVDSSNMLVGLGKRMRVEGLFAKLRKNDLARTGIA